ncbi:latex clearing [Fusarium mexicanum]|uniref:Latex clearing n=1 Tax=Fusarium mexicanum TaxID=751941 RepID=A0A8H5ILT6_9HYPO|nr:latex clearing [Fusarium mexicanum]
MDYRFPSYFKDRRIVWGHSFNWTSGHKTTEELDHYLYSYDKLATDALDRLDLISPPTTKGWKCPHGSGPGQRDIYELLKKHASSDEILGQLWEEATTIPEWVDWDQIQRGQQVVYQFSGQILFGLMYKSLLGGMGAYRIVETLSRTGGFGINVTRRRLLETLQHFMEVVDDLDAIKPGGKGYVSSVRVRLLHASVRRRLMQLENQNPGYFDMEKWGVPINDLHTIATISAYSAAIVYMALPRQGIYLSEKQTADYLALWRYVGYLLGTPVDWMATPQQAKAMLESIAVSEVAPSANSQILANNILTAEARAPPLNMPREVLAAHAYRLNGEEFASALGIEKPDLRSRLVVWMQCTILLFISYSYPWMPTQMQKRQEQYLPRLGMLTELGVRKDLEAERTTSADFSKSMTISRRAVLLVGTILGAITAVSLVRFVGVSNIPRHLLSAVLAQQSLVWAD